MAGSNNRSVFRPDFADMQFGYKDESDFFISDQIIIPQGRAVEFGSYYKDKDNTWFIRPETTVARTGLPNAIKRERELVDFNIQPRAQTVPLPEIELMQPQQYGYMDRAQFIQNNVEWLGRAMKIDQECLANDFIETTGNYEASKLLTLTTSGAAYIRQWDDYTNSDPLATAQFVRRELKWVNTMQINWNILLTLQNHPKVLAAAGVQGTKRDMMLSPWVTVDFLKNYFNVQNVLVGMADVMDNSALPSATATSGIWGNHVWFGWVNPQASINPMVPTFAKRLYLQMSGFENAGGFVTAERDEPREGGFGVKYIDTWVWDDNQLYGKKNGFLVSDVLATP